MSARRKSLPLYLCMSSWFLKRQGICDSHDTYQYFCLIRKKLFSSTSALSIVIILPISLIIFFFCLKVCQMTRSKIFSRNKHFHLSFLYIFIISNFFFKNNAGDRLEVVLMCVLSSQKFFSTIFIFACLTLKKMKEFTSIKNHYLLNTVEL